MSLASRRKRTTLEARPRVENLEGREVPAMLVGLTTTDSLVTFDSATPGTLISNVAVTGLTAGDDIVGIDYRPATGGLFGVTKGVGGAGRVYTLNAATGVATKVGMASFGNLTGTSFGIDFNPIPDRIRIIGNDGQSLRVNPADGTLSGTDTNPFFEGTNDSANGFTNPAFFDTDADGDGDPGTNPPTLPTNQQFTGAAYTRNPGVAAGTFVTTLYAIDSANDLLVRIGGADGTNPDGTTNSPNQGQSFAVDYLRDAATFAKVDFGPANGFDITAGTDEAFAVTGGNLYSVNLTSASVTSLGTAGATLDGLAVAPAAAGAGTVQLAVSAVSFTAARDPVAVTVTRTGGAAGAVTVKFATSGGTATAGTDYLPASGTLTFADGQTSQQIFLSLPAGTPAPAPAKTFQLTLSMPGGGATLGATAAATVTIPAVAADPTSATSGRRFALGNASQVAVYDATSGTAAFTFSPFGGTFTGGVRVATGDINGDGIDDLVVAAGPGGAPRVSVFNGATLTASSQPVLLNFFVYEQTFTGGVYVSTGDVNGDGFDDVVVGSGNGGGPRIRVLDGATLTNANQTVVADFFAFESTFRGGVFVAAGEFNGDSKDDLVAGAAVGGGPRVTIFDGATAPGGNPTVLANYFAYDQAFRNGVFVATGDVNADGRLDVVTGPGFGGAPDIRSFSGRTSTSLGGFFAFGSTLRGGAPVGTADLNGDGRDEILVGSPTDGPGTARVFDFTGASAFADLQPFGTTTLGGVFVG